MIEVTERAGDRDRADMTRVERGVGFKDVQGSSDGGDLPRDPRVRATVYWSQRLEAAKNGGVHHPIGKRLKPECGPARRALGDQRSWVKAVQIGTDDGGIHDGRTVVDQRGHFAQWIVLHHLGVTREGVRVGELQRDAGFVGDDPHFACERGGGGGNEQHHAFVVARELSEEGMITFGSAFRVLDQQPQPEVPKMFRAHLIPALSLVALTAACTAEVPGETNAPPVDPPAQGGGGSGADDNSGGNAMGGADPTGGGGGAVSQVETRVGAAYPHGGDARIVLIDRTGTRSALFNPSNGLFEGADDIEELEGGLPLVDVRASAAVGDDIYLFAHDGSVTIYDRSQASFSTPEPLAEVLEDVPFNEIGAAFGAGDQLFVFNAGGASYAAYDTAAQSWSQIYDFATEFGGGGAPIANVGAAYANAAGGYVLFDLSGASYCIYGNGGQFSDDFDIDELGGGGLSFNDD